MPGEVSAEIVTLTGPNARFRNPGSDRHMRFQCRTGAAVAAPKAEIGENCPNVTSPSKACLPRRGYWESNPCGLYLLPWL